MKRRNFITTGAGSLLALGAVGCSNDNAFSPNGTAGIISGSVTSAEGTGISGVSIYVSGADFTGYTKTDDNGIYAIEVPVKGAYTLTSAKAGYSFTPRTKKIAVTGTQAHVVDISGIILGGTDIAVNELGTTGIMVSHYGFGSHTQETGASREYLIREAFDRGITTFDVYNRESSLMQYAPMGRYLAPVINDVTFSITLETDRSNKTVVDEIDYVLSCFGKDRVDMVRTHAWTTDNSQWPAWEELFRLRDEGKIGAVGVPIHTIGLGTDLDDPDIVLDNDLAALLEHYPDDLDYVIFPYNFYHNLLWNNEAPEGFEDMVVDLRSRGIGVVNMKPLGSEAFVNTLKEAATAVNPDIPYGSTAIKYTLNSGLEPDMILNGMSTMSHLFENIPAFYNPEMSEDEAALLEEVKGIAGKIAHRVMPPHYRFLNAWAPGTCPKTGRRIV